MFMSGAATSGQSDGETGSGYSRTFVGGQPPHLGGQEVRDVRAALIRAKAIPDACFEAGIPDHIGQMDRSTATVPEPVYRLAEGVLFQQLDRESVLLNMKTEQYFGLDPVGTRIWQLLTTKHSVEATVTIMRAEYEVDEAKLRQDVLALADRLTAKGLLVAEPGPTDAPRA